MCYLRLWGDVIFGGGHQEGSLPTMRGSEKARKNHEPDERKRKSPTDKRESKPSG